MSEVMIPQQNSEEQSYLERGVHLVKFTKVENHADKDGNLLQSRAGDNALRFHMKDKNGATFVDVVYYGRPEVQWSLDKLMTAIRVDNKGRKVSPSEVIGQKVYIAIKEVVFVTADGEPIYKDNGDQKIYKNRLRYFPYIKDGIAPTVAEDSLLEQKIGEGGAPPPPPAPAPEPLADEQEEAEEAEVASAEPEEAEEPKASAEKAPAKKKAPAAKAKAPAKDEDDDWED